MPPIIHSTEHITLMVLKVLLGAWDSALEKPELACGAGCAVCCSDRVMLTTLEGRLLVADLERRGRGDLLELARSRDVAPGSGPALTFNAEAALWVQGKNPETPLVPPVSGVCPFLEDGLCAVYGARPLACRVMISRRTCEPGGSALQEPFWLTLAGAFHQLVEHLDRAGAYGLLPSVLAHLAGQDREPLLACQPLPGLPAPQQHQARLQEVINRTLARPVMGRPLGAWLD